MSHPLKEIVERREALVRASSAQRDLLALDAADVARSLWFVERAARAARLITARPLILAATAGVMLALGPRTVLARGSRTAAILLSAWRLGRSLRSVLR